jgi:hypothetical protein
MGIVVALLLTLLVAAAPDPADATGIKISGTSSTVDIHRGSANLYRDPRTNPNPKITES